MEVELTTLANMEVELTTLAISTVEVEWLRELLMDLPVVEKLIPIVLMNCDSNCDYQGQQFKGKHEVIKARQEEFKIYQEIEEHQCYSFGLYQHS
jgi:hypothetical protein